VEAYFDKLWGIFVGLGWWMLNRLTAKIDALEANKADNDALNQQRQELRDMDKKVDQLNHTSIGRVEYKADIGLLHNRLNDKEDKIKTIRVEKPLK
jgi:TolA-binding protein